MYDGSHFFERLQVLGNPGSWLDSILISFFQVVKLGKQIKHTVLTIVHYFIIYQICGIRLRNESDELIQNGF